MFTGEDVAAKPVLTQSEVTLPGPRLTSYSEAPNWGCWPPGEISADIPAGLGVVWRVSHEGVPRSLFNMLHCTGKTHNQLLSPWCQQQKP